MGIVVIGSTFVDIKGYPFGEYIPAGRNAGRVVEVHGGVCRNIAENIANVGMPSSIVTLLDESGTSTDVINRLEEHGCSTKYTRRIEEGLGLWLAIFDETGDVVASIARRPDLSEIERILDECGDEIFSQADAICIEIDIEEPIFKRVLELAKKHDKRVFSPVTNMTIGASRREYVGQLHCLVCNQQEAGILFGEDYDDFAPNEMAVELVAKVKELGIPGMVVTMGAQGCVHAEADGTSGHCPARKVDVVDTTGAGDALFSGVAVGLTSGKTLAEACEIGTKLAASVIVTEENVCPRLAPEELGLQRAFKTAPGTG